MTDVYNRLIVKILVVINLLVACNVSQAQSDGFFDEWQGMEQRDGGGGSAPDLPAHGQTGDQDMPLGGGIVLLGVFAAAYLVIKKRRAAKAGAMLLMAAVSIDAFAQEVDVEWTVNPHAYQYSMTGFARVVVDGGAMTNAQYEIGAFCGEECRGKALCNKVAGGYYQAPLMIYGNTNGDVLTFKVMDHNNNWVIFADCDDTLHFKSNRYYATPYAPKAVSLATITYYFNGGAVDAISSYTLSNGKPVVKLPLRNCRVEVRASANYVTGSTELKDVVINDGVSVVIGAGSGLSAVETVSNTSGTSGITIKAAAPQDTKGDYWDEKFSSVGSLVTVSSGVQGTMETWLDNSATEHDWHLISSPVTNQVIYDGTGMPDFEPGDGDDFYLWDETAATWRNIKTDGYSTGNQFHNINDDSFSFVAGRGYLASYSESGVKEYSGVFNQGDVTVNLTRTETINDNPNRYLGFNLVGNPYPSFLDWENAEGWDRSRIYGYDAEPDESRCVVWIYNEDAGNYATYVQGSKVATNHGTRYIAPGQAFFVKATQAGGFTMRDAARTNEHTKSGFMKTTKEVPGRHYMNNRVHGGVADMCPANKKDGVADMYPANKKDGVADMCPTADGSIMKIRVENEKFGADEVALAVSGNEMKVEKLFSMSETAPAMCFNEDGKYSIIIDNDFENSIALNFKAKQMGKYKISINPETAGFGFVELEDSFTGEKVNLLTDGYEFYSSPNDREDRFRLNLGYNENANDSQNFVYQNGNDLIVKGKGSLKVIDLLGRTIFEKELTGDENVISRDNINKGVNIFKLEDKTEKIIIR